MPTLTERLGFSAEDVVAVVHCDDIGMCHAANTGSFEALENGPATCGSVMVPCPWFREAAERATANPELDLGVHLTLNAEWQHYRWGPVAGRSAVPSLLDSEGYLPRTVLEVVQKAKPDDVERELRAQIDKALDAGIDVTHVDSHMGTIFFPQFLEIYVRLARDYGVPAFTVNADPSTLEANGIPASAEPMFRRLMQELEETGIPILDGFDANSLGFAEGEGEAHNGGRLDRLQPGVNYLICHPATDGEELRAAIDTSHQRDFERRYYGGEAGRKAFHERGIKTVGMRELRSLLRAG